MTTRQKLVIAASVVMFGFACNRPAPCPQANTSQAAPTPQPSPAAASDSADIVTDGPSYKPKRGYVPDEKTAIAIAVAVWNPIYGKEHIETEKPYHASLRGGVWIVTGSLPEGWVGGTAIAEIAQNDGRVLRVIHEK
jgi:hypothetical protein